MNALQSIDLLPVSSLNLGSGKDFRAEAFNIDVDDSWNPDAVLDLSAVDLGDEGLVVETRRFGRVRLAPGCFDHIVANDVLEHVPNLMKLMTTCLGLLRLGGRFEISVPYDLSFGAWQDPTHVRAFNERSWLYYTDWFWYMGWDSARFVQDQLKFVLSPSGTALQRGGASRDTVLTTPRAIDSMSVVLRKIELSETDRQTWQHWRERRRQAQAGHHAAPPPQPAPALNPFPGKWSDHTNRHCIWIVSPENYSHIRAFDEVAVALSRAFAELGGTAPIVHHPSEWGGRAPIVLGAHLLPANAGLPSGTVLYNFEQVDRGSVWLNDRYLSLLRRYPVLDYSHRNLAALRTAGIGHARLLQLGYVEDLTRIPAAAARDVDVLFYGSMNERRAAVLDRLRSHGLTVAHLFDVYGEQRDAAIARAKLVLNMHFYEAAVFETARVEYLLANGICVVTEGRHDDPDIAPFRDGLEICGYDHLVERCLTLLSDDSERRALAERGFEAVQRFRQADLLRACIEVSAPTA